MPRQPGRLLPVAPSSGRLQPVPGEAVTLTGGFWAERQSLNSHTFLSHCDEWITRLGWIDNFAIAAEGSAAIQRQGKLFTDSDVYKFLEALCWEVGRKPNPELSRRIDAITRLLDAAQEPDGYLNTFFGHRGHDARYTDLAHGHELYCAGHLFQAAVARLRTHGEDDLTRVAFRLAERIYEDFGPAGRDGIDGHPEVELGLIELYRETDDGRWLALASDFIERRGRQTLEHHAIGHEYYQDDMPFRDGEVFRGHVVRSLYLAASAVDVAVETGDRGLLDAVVRQWDATIARRTYLTGGMGSRHLGESYGNDYELPPDRAYTETCGAVASIMVAWRLLLATGEARFGDAIERALYNMVATSVNPQGNRFFYCNPLHQRQHGIEVPDDVVPFRKDTLRAPWFWVSCCPTNWARLMATLSAYCVTTDDRGIQIHQYGTSTISVRLAGNRPVELEMDTDYPWDGRIRLRVRATDGEPWKLRLRVPAWAALGATVTAGGTTTPAEPGLVTVERPWQVGDEVVLDLPMAPRYTWPDPRVDAIRGTVAVERGPLVYCLESTDLPDPSVGTDAVTIDARRSLSDAAPPVELSAHVGGLVAVAASGRTVQLPPAGPWPYLEDASAPTMGRVDLTLIPYHLWSNRGVSTMRVWIPTAGDRREESTT